MPNIQKIGGFAAFANAFLGLAMLVVALGLIGPAVLSDHTKFIEMALRNPGPLFLQDILKLISAVSALLMVLAVSSRLQAENPSLVRTGTFFGIFSILLLLANAGLSSYSVMQVAGLGADAGSQLNLVIGLLGTAAVMVNGVWYLLENWVGRKSRRLPGGMTTLGLVIGVISLVPLLAIFVLLLSLIWSVWLGQVLLKSE